MTQEFIEQPEAPPPVALYLMPGCGTCHQVKGFLERHRVPVELRWLTEPAHQAWVDDHLKHQGGRRQAPFLVVGPDVLEGYQPQALRTLLQRVGYDLSQPTAPRPGASVRARIELPTTALWVTNFIDGSIDLVDPVTLQKVGDPLPLGEDSNPVSIAHDPDHGTVAVADMGRHRVVCFDTHAGGYLGGSMETATLATPLQLGDIVFDSRRHRFYVGSIGTGMVLAIDSRTGRFVHGDVARSALPVGSFGGGLCYDPVRDRLYVRTKDGVVCVDAETFAPWRGDLDASTLPLAGGRNLALDAERGMLYVPTLDGHLHYIDTARFAFAGSGHQACCVATERTPLGVVAAPALGRVYVTCMGTNRLQAFDAARPAALDLPCLEVMGGSRSLTLVDDATLAISSFDDASVVLVDLHAHGYRLGSFARSRIAVGQGPRGMAYIAARHEGTGAR